MFIPNMNMRSIKTIWTLLQSAAIIKYLTSWKLFHLFDYPEIYFINIVFVEVG